MPQQSSSGQLHSSNRKKSRKHKRVEIRVQLDPSTSQGIVLNYLGNKPPKNRRESVMKAVSAFYMPYAYRSEGVSQQQIILMLRRAIAELELWKMQLCHDFGFAESLVVGSGVAQTLTQSHSQVKTNLENLDYLNDYDNSRAKLSLF